MRPLLLYIEEKKMEYRKANQPEGVNLLASMLICYREISTVFYEPKNRTVKITFTVNKVIDEDYFNDIVAFLDESIHTYHMMEGLPFIPIEFTMETQGIYAFLHIVRDLESLSSGELSIITTILRDRLGDSLIMGDTPLDEDILAMQEENLENMLLSTQAMQLRHGLVGVREGDAVMVYDR